MLNTDSNTYYQITISNQKNVVQNGVEVDSLVFNNFATKFNFKTPFYCTVDSNNIGNYLDVLAPYPSFDYSGYRWALDIKFTDSLGRKTSWIKNDTINLYFNMCNIQFYIYDAQPYYCKNVMHIAVKEH